MTILTKKSDKEPNKVNLMKLGRSKYFLLVIIQVPNRETKF
jgi:hypothetical protein